MFILNANGTRAQIEGAAKLLEEIGGFGAISWHEIERRQFRLEVYGEDEDAMKCGIGAIALVMHDLQCSYSPLPNSDWIKMSLDGLPPVSGGRFRIVGSHNKAKHKTGTKEIIIDAGEAFGTGHHGTTMGCLLALERNMRQGKRPKKVLDVGTGSAVLAIAAAKFGAKAIGTEIDARAAFVARENTKINGVHSNVKIYVANGIRRTNIRKNRGYDLVFANILMKPLIRLSFDLASQIAKDGQLVLSGLLTTQEPAIRRAFAARGLILTNRYRQDVWSTLTYTRH